MKKRTETNRIIIHHSLSPRDSTCKADLYNWHITERGWEDIGYHYFINSDGVVYKCRDIKYQGAHARGRNHDSIGVCLAGDFRKEVPSYAQLDTLNELIEGLILVYGELYLEFHREKRNKCPGKYFQQTNPFDN